MVDSPKRKFCGSSRLVSVSFEQGRLRSLARSSLVAIPRMPNRSGVRVEVTTRFQRAFDRLPPHLQQLTVQRVAIFAANPFDPRLRTHKLKGKLQAFWSFSVTGAHRVMVTFPQAGMALLHDVGTHDIYR